MMELIVPLMVIAVGAWALHKKQDTYSCLVKGAKDGLGVVLSIAPSLVILLSAVYMLRASGLVDALAEWLSPALNFIGIPPETLSLMLLRPFSGSGALAVGTDIIRSHGPDSFAGRCAAVMLGSTETTFYVLAVYFGAKGGKKVRRAIPAALAADLCGFIMAAVTVRMFFK